MKKKFIKINFYLTFNIIGVGQSHSPSNPPHFDFKSLAVPSSFGRSVNLFHPTRAMCSLFLSERYFRKHLCHLKKEINRLIRKLSMQPIATWPGKVQSRKQKLICWLGIYIYIISPIKY